MLRVFARRGWFFGNTSNRRQNFFELNPIFPDQGQKDFDIYNVDYNHVLSRDLADQDKLRKKQIKQKLTKEVYLSLVLEKTYGENNGEVEVDEETGFPIGVHQNFDNFIEVFKREKKVGNNIVGQFEGLVMKLMEKFGAKSELELIKIFRFNLANMKKKGFKDQIRALMINSAFIRFINKRKHKGLSTQSLSLTDLDPFLSSQSTSTDTPIKGVSERQLNDVVVSDTLRQLDEKIAKLQQQIKAKALADGTYIPTFHPKFGVAISEDSQLNMNFDINFPRGFSQLSSTNEHCYTVQQIQDRMIQTRINKLFFASVLNKIQSKKILKTQQLIDIHKLPMNLRQKDKIINSLLFKYKELDLLVQPDMKEIYQEIDMALKKIDVKVVPNFIQNQSENTYHHNQQNDVRERIVTKDALLWKQLDVEEVFDPEYYNQDQVNKIKLEEKELTQLTPSAVMQFSLNKMPFNLYRHQDLNHFAVFNKYRKKIYSDYLTDKTIDPQLQFKFFSLEQAQKGLKRIKKPEEIPDKFYGYGKRKSTEAEVFVTPGTGKVTINNEPLADYFGDVYHRGEALKPLIFTETAGQYDLEFTVVGGGVHSQSQCLAIALTQALIMINPKHEKILAQFGLVGIDDRKKEPKRIGLYSARVRPPYVRR